MVISDWAKPVVGSMQWHNVQWNCLRLSLKIKKQYYHGNYFNVPDVEQFATGVRPIDCACSFLDWNLILIKLRILCLSPSACMTQQWCVLIHLFLYYVTCSRELTSRNVRMPGTWSSMIKSNMLSFFWTFLMCNNPRTCSFKTPTRRWAAQWKSLALARKCEHVVLKWHHRLSFSQGKSGDNTGRGNASLCFFHPCSTLVVARQTVALIFVGVTILETHTILHSWIFTRLWASLCKGGERREENGRNWVVEVNALCMVVESNMTSISFEE